MKRIFALLLTCALIFSLAGCGGNQSDKDDESSASAPPVQAASMDDESLSKVGLSGLTAPEGAVIDRFYYSEKLGALQIDFSSLDSAGFTSFCESVFEKLLAAGTITGVDDKPISTIDETFTVGPNLCVFSTDKYAVSIVYQPEDAENIVGRTCKFAMSSFEVIDNIK